MLQVTQIDSSALLQRLSSFKVQFSSVTAEITSWHLCPVTLQSQQETAVVLSKLALSQNVFQCHTIALSALGDSGRSAQRQRINTAAQQILLRKSGGCRCVCRGLQCNVEQGQRAMQWTKASAASVGDGSVQGSSGICSCSPAGQGLNNRTTANKRALSNPSCCDWVSVVLQTVQAPPANTGSMLLCLNR